MKIDVWYFSCVIWLIDWFGWFKVLCELAMCDLLDVDIELYGLLLTKVEIMRFQVLLKPVPKKPQSKIC